METDPKLVTVREELKLRVQEKPGHSSACDSVPAGPPLPLSLSPSKPQHRPPLLAVHLQEACSPQASFASLKRLRVPPIEQQRPLLHARGVQALGFPLFVLRVTTPHAGLLLAHEGGPIGKPHG